MTERAEVPCNGCTLCCRKDLIMLHPECGDDPALYDTMPFVNPLTGEPGLAIRKNELGDACIYLGPSGCTIHDHAPAICKEFDCGVAWASRTRAQRKRLVAIGYFNAEVLKQGYRVQRLRGLA